MEIQEKSMDIRSQCCVGKSSCGLSNEGLSPIAGRELGENRQPSTWRIAVQLTPCSNRPGRDISHIPHALFESVLQKGGLTSIFLTDMQSCSSIAEIPLLTRAGGIPPQARMSSKGTRFKDGGGGVLQPILWCMRDVGWGVSLR